MDSNGIAANNATDFIPDIRAVLQCIRQAGVNLTKRKCHFGIRQVEFRSRTILPEGISLFTRSSEDSNVSYKTQIPQIRKGLTALPWIRKLEKLHPQDGRNA